MAKSAKKKNSPAIAHQWDKGFEVRMGQHYKDYRYRERCEQGEGTLLITVLNDCLNACTEVLDPDPKTGIVNVIHHYRLPPFWVLEQLQKVNALILDGADPNEAFGYTWPKSKHLKGNRELKRKAFSVLVELHALHNSDPKMYPLDLGTMAIIGKRYAMSASTIARLRRELPNTDKVASSLARCIKAPKAN
jgi:hypothetical protein